MKYKSVLDLHTHTVASGHAYCSLREMARAASDKGLELLGITEHAPMMPGTCHEFYFNNLKVVPRELYGIQLLLGSEVNICLLYTSKVDLTRQKRSDDLRIREKLETVVPMIESGYINNILLQDDFQTYQDNYRELLDIREEYGYMLSLIHIFQEQYFETEIEMLE